MYGKFQKHLQDELAAIKEAGLYKNERNIASPQGAEITLEDGSVALNFCANNYLGLADSQRLIDAAKKAMDERGYGMSSVRFICGTQDLHKQLEKAVADFFHTEDTILYASCFDANGGVFEPLLTAEDAIISDSLNHASIIDGVRLCKAVRYRYANADMEDLERCLKEAQAQRFRIICTDGVFSMDGNVAPMDKICDLAEKYDALVMVDESHSAGVVGKTGRGVAEQFDCYGRIDIFKPQRRRGRQDRPRCSRAVRLLRTHRHLYRHPWQSFRRRRGWFYHRPERDYRHAPPAFPPVSFLQFHPADDCRSGHRDVQDPVREQRLA